MLQKPFMLPRPLEAYKGSYFEQVLRWTSDDVPVDIDGYGFQMMVRESYKSDTAIVTIGTSEGGITIIDANGGELKYSLTIEQTNSFTVPLETNSPTQIPYKDFPFDVDAIPLDATKRFQFMKGVLRVYAEITR